MLIINDEKQLISDLWLDQPDAHAKIDEKFLAGDLSDVEGENLHYFTDEGYMVLGLRDPDSAYRTFDAEIDRLWHDKPSDLSVGRRRVTQRTSYRDLENSERKIGYRMKDPHSHSDIIRHFYLHPEIFR